MQTLPNANPAPVPSYDISQSKDTLDLAKDLARFIKENKLSTQVQGKEFVNVEGWQYAGARLGIVAIVEHVVSRGSDLELKYEAKVSLFDLRHQVTVGMGYAWCSNKESGKKMWQEYAVASMAQTRAIGKAYRNILAWIIRAAGYEPTPAEEMDYQGAPRAGGNTGAPAQVTSMALARPAPAAAVVEEVPVVPFVYASASQKEDIISLLNHPKIERQEKTKVLLNINNYSPERAEARIRQLVGIIEARTGKFVEAGKYLPYSSRPAQAAPETPTPTPAAAAPALVTRMLKPARTNSVRDEAERKLREFVQQHEQRLGRPEADRLLTICGNSRYSPADIRAELEAANQWLRDDCAA